MKNAILCLFLCILCLSVFAGCTNTDTSAEDAVQAAIENSTEHTELKPANDGENDPQESQTAKEEQNVNSNITIVHFANEISTNRLTEGEPYDAYQTKEMLPNSIFPTGLPADLLASNLSYKDLSNGQNWYGFKCANSQDKRYIFFQATNADNFDGVDDEFIMSMPSSEMNGQKVYIATYPCAEIDGNGFLAYYGKNNCRCLLECINLTQEEFLNILNASV